jgi:hypothetical protein
MLEVGVPANIIERRLGEVDLQVNPLIVGCDFELVIVEKTLRLRIDKCFHHVTIPEFPTLFGGVFACVNVQRSISAPIGEVYVTRGPETCHLHFRIREMVVPEAVLIEPDAGSILPHVL